MIDNFDKKNKHKIKQFKRNYTSYPRNYIFAKYSSLKIQNTWSASGDQFKIKIDS